MMCHGSLLENSKRESLEEVACDKKTVRGVWIAALVNNWGAPDG